MEKSAGSEIQLDIVIPVYNEGENIVKILRALEKQVQTKFRVLICYDFDEDTTLKAIQGLKFSFLIELIRNPHRGPHSAVLSGFKASEAPVVLVCPADDDYNPPLLDKMYAQIKSGSDISCASRFIPGGTMKGCPWLKALLVRVSAFTLYHLARVPSHDSSNGLRMFSRRVIKEIPIESNQGFTYSIELLVKAHRLGWRITEIPAKWIERTEGESRFQVLKWIAPYLRWYFYAFATTYLREGPKSVKLKGASARE